MPEAPKETANSGPSKTAIISTVISIAAFVLSLTTAYWLNWRSASIEVALSRDLFISNTIGGIPDSVLGVVFRGVGAPAKGVLIERISLEIENNTTGKVAAMEAIKDTRGQRLPLLVTGGQSETKRLFFAVNDYLPDEISRNDTWFKELATLVPETDRAVIEGLRVKVRDELLGPGPKGRETGTEPKPNEPSEASLMMQLFGGASAGEVEEMSEQLAESFRNLEPTELEKVLFFTAGSYSFNLKVFDPFGRELASIDRRFEVDSVLAEALQRQFNENIRVELLRP